MMSSHVANVVMISTCCKRWFNAQEEMLALSDTQRHVDGPLCTNKLQKHGMFCGLPKPNCQIRLHIPGMVLFVYGQELYS